MFFENEFYVYDGNNRMVMSTSFRGIRALHEFDANGNEIARMSENETVFATRDVLEYDGFNRLIGIDSIK